MFDFKWKENGSIKLLIIVGTRPEIIRLAATIKRCREYFDCCVAHTGQNYDKNLNDIFWSDFDLGGPDVWMNVVGENLGQTCGNVIARSYELMAEIKPDALLVLGDTIFDFIRFYGWGEILDPFILAGNFATCSNILDMFKS